MMQKGKCWSWWENIVHQERARVTFSSAQMNVCSIRGGVKPMEDDIKSNGKVKSHKERKKDECKDLKQKPVLFWVFKLRQLKVDAILRMVF
jgi:hypothetical protein